MKTFHKKSKTGIDITAAAGVIWKPDFLYKGQVDEEMFEQQYFLNKDGEIVWFRKIYMDFKCQFDFSRYPNDHQNCAVIPYISNYYEDKVRLNSDNEVGEMSTST